MVTQFKVYILSITIGCFSWSISISLWDSWCAIFFFMNLYYKQHLYLCDHGENFFWNFTAYGCNLLTVSMFGDLRQHIIMLEKSAPCDTNEEWWCCYYIPVAINCCKSHEKIILFFLIDLDSFIFLPKQKKKKIHLSPKYFLKLRKHMILIKCYELDITIVIMKWLILMKLSLDEWYCK